MRHHLRVVESSGSGLLGHERSLLLLLLLGRRLLVALVMMYGLLLLLRRGHLSLGLRVTRSAGASGLRGKLAEMAGIVHRRWPLLDVGSLLRILLLLGSGRLLIGWRHVAVEVSIGGLISGGRSRRVADGHAVGIGLVTAQLHVHDGLMMDHLMVGRRWLDHVLLALGSGQGPEGSRAVGNRLHGHVADGEVHHLLLLRRWLLLLLNLTRRWTHDRLPYVVSAFQMFRGGGDAGTSGSSGSCWWLR